MNFEPKRVNKNQELFNECVDGETWEHSALNGMFLPYPSPQGL